MPPPAPVRTVLVTGASSGIGRCVALGLKQRGWAVFATARSDADLQALGDAGLTPVPLDLATSASTLAAAKTVLEATDGRLDALFNNAAFAQPGAVEDLSRDALRAQFEVNLFGTIELTNAVLPAMRARGHGRIVMNGSVLGLVAMPYRGAYNATKFALEGITDTLRLELRGSGVHAVLIEPGPIQSNFRAAARRQFEAHIDADHSAHAGRYRDMRRQTARGRRQSRFTRPPEAVLKKVIHALEAPRPRPRYYVTFPTHLFGFLRRVLPTRVLDWILARA